MPVIPKHGGPWSLFCTDCGVWTPNTANAEMKKEGVYATSHVCGHLTDDEIKDEDFKRGITRKQVIARRKEESEKDLSEKLVEKLREQAFKTCRKCIYHRESDCSMPMGMDCDIRILRDSAKEIERLRVEVEELKDRLVVESDEHIKKLEWLYRELDNKREESEWVSVKDKLPEEYDTVLLYTLGGEIVEGFYGSESGEFRMSNGFVCYVSHWMKLPKAPNV